MSASYAHPEVLADTGWVASHAASHPRDAGVRVVEVDVDTKAYDEGHVPGAIAWAWNTQLCDTLVRDILPKAAFEALMTQSGIGSASASITCPRTVTGECALMPATSTWFSASSPSRKYGPTVCEGVAISILSAPSVSRRAHAGRYRIDSRAPS